MGFQLIKCWRKAEVFEKSQNPSITSGSQSQELLLLHDTIKEMLCAQVGCMRQVLGPGALGKPRGNGWRGRWEGGLGWGTHVNP